MEWKKKICLGTAQFGSIYGITNENKKQLSVKKIKEFLILLKKNKIKFIDTALNYTNVDKKLSKTKINLNNFKIIKKIPPPQKKEKFYKKKTLKSILKSKKLLKINNFYAILIHGCQNLNTNQAKLIGDILLELKKKKITLKVGLSLYNIQELDFMLKFFTPDIIQVPHNIFDNRFTQNKILNKISKYNIDLHIRSIFLQGLLLIDPQNINIKFSRWIKLFKKWHFYCTKNKISKLEGAVNFVLRTNKIKKIVVGFANTEEFIEFLKIKTKRKLAVPKLLISKIKNIEKLINPYNWKT